MTDSPVDRPEIREAIALLREAGITPEQYATLDITEHWRFGGVEYPNREAAFVAAREKARSSGEWIEVWVEYGAEYEGAESWIITPEDVR